jgi:transposase
MTQKRFYDQEFKLGAVKLVLQEGRSINSVSADLGLSKASLHNWIKAYKANQTQAFSGKNYKEEQELRQLRRENEILRQERDILKKAVGIFSTTRK